MGSRDLQAGDLLAAVENMLPGGTKRRLFYLGIEFIRKGKLPEKLAEWQSEVLAAYPAVADLALDPAENVSLLPESSLAVRIHSVGGWGAITMGKNLTFTLFELAGMNVKSNPKYGSEKKGQPTTFYSVFAHEPIRMNCELQHVDVVLSPDPNVFRHSNPLAGLADGGLFVIQSTLAPEELWASFPPWAQKIVRERELRVFHLDAFRIARDETDVADLQFRMQGAAFQGAFFRTSKVMADEGLAEERPVRHHPQAAREEVRPPRQDGGGGQLPGDPPRLRRGGRARLGRLCPTRPPPPAKRSSPCRGTSTARSTPARASPIRSASSTRCAPPTPAAAIRSPTRSRRSPRSRPRPACCAT